jgi:hypothetical protein
MSVPDYVAMGRELAANRDATLVNAANRGVKYHDELEAAKQRIAELGNELFNTKSIAQAIKSDYLDLYAANEEAERKLATATAYGAAKAINAILIAIRQLSDRQRKVADTPLSVGRFQGIEKCAYVIEQALAPIEQPQEAKQQLPGEEADGPLCDTDRLNEAEHMLISQSLSLHAWHAKYKNASELHWYQGPTLRAAIDAAMQARKATA